MLYLLSTIETFLYVHTLRTLSRYNVINFYSKTNQMHNISNLFYFGTTFYMFRTVSPSIIRSLRLYIQHQVYVIQVLWLLASGNEMFHLFTASKQPQDLYDIYPMLYVES